MPKQRESKITKGVRIPKSMKDALEENERRTRLPEPVQIRVALEEYLTRQGLWPFPPPDSKASRRP